MTSLLVVFILAFALVDAADICDNSSIPESCAGIKDSNEYINCRAVNVLESLFYESRTKSFSNDGGWWNIANTVEALINYCDISGLCDDALINIIYEVTNANTRTTKSGNDDIQWWSLAMIRLYEWRGNMTYLEKAMEFYDFVYHRAWDTKACHGGLWWNTGKTYKNAITNEQALTNTAKLYKITKNSTYLKQFNEIWNWFYEYKNTGKGMINTQWLVNDGLNINSKNSSDCSNNHQTEWTYNQGVILGGLSTMYLIDNNEMYVNISWNIIQSVMKHIIATKHNIDILHELESDKNVEQSSDQSQFKGIFMRYLMYWYQNIILTDKNGKYGNMKQEIIDFVNNQMMAIYNNCMNPSCYAQFSAVWNASWVHTNIEAIAQVSTIDVWNWAFIIN
eukprot:142530_1